MFVFLALVIALGLGVSVLSGYLLGEITRRLGIPVTRPVMSAVLGYFFAWGVCAAGFVLGGFAVALAPNGFDSKLATWAMGFALMSAVFLPLLAMLFNVLLLRSDTRSSSGTPISFARASTLVLATQGLLSAVAIAFVWLSRA